MKSESATGSSDTQRVRTNLTVEIQTVDFDTDACVLRVKGRNTEENRFVKQGAHHTVQLELHQKFTLAKDLWDSVARERIEAACDPGRAADVAAVVLQEGLAHVCLLTPSMTLTRARLEVPIPRKRRGSCSQHDRAVERFYEQIIEAILRHIKFDGARVRRRERMCFYAQPNPPSDQVCARGEPRVCARAVPRVHV